MGRRAGLCVLWMEWSGLFHAAVASSTACTSSASVAASSPSGITSAPPGSSVPAHVVANKRLGDRKEDVTIESPAVGGRVKVRLLLPSDYETDNVDKFKQAFQEDAWIFFAHRDSTLIRGLIANSFERWATPPAQRILGRVISVTGRRYRVCSSQSPGRRLWAR